MTVFNSTVPDWAIGIVQQPLSSTLLVVFYIIVSYCILWIIYARTFHPLAKYPGPWLASFSRLWYMRQVYNGNVEKVQLALHRKHGPIVRIAPNELSVSDPAAIKVVLATRNPWNKTDFYDPFAPALSKHGELFTKRVDAQHAVRRRIVNNNWSLTSILESESYVNDCTDIFLQRMREFADSGAEVDLGKWLAWYAFDVVGEVVFGGQLGFLREGRDARGWMTAIDTLMPLSTLQCVMPKYSRPLTILAAAFSAKVRRSISSFGDIIKAAVEAVDVRQEQMKKDSVGRVDMLAKLFRIMNEKGDKVDFRIEDVRSETFVPILAGSDTTAAAMRVIMYSILTSPSVLAKLRAEIDEATANGTLSSTIAYSEAVKLPYLAACIKEGFRIYPSVSMSLSRQVPASGAVVTGDHFVPGGYRVGINPYVVHRDKEVFGDDAEEYLPERWFRPGAQEMERSLLHFGAGTRTCIGKNLSLCEIYKLVPTVLREFDMQLSRGEWKTRNSWFMYHTNIIVKLKRRTISTL